MEKNIVIIGKNGSNKSCRAEEISNQFKNNEVIYVSAIDRNSFDELLFMRCTQETKLIIIDIRKKNFALIYMTYNEIITIKKKGFEQFKISPKFIFVCDEKINKEAFKGASLLQRFEIIDMETYTMKRCEMIEEPKMSNGCYGYSHKLFTKKLPKGVFVNDYNAGKINIVQNGENKHVDLAFIFGDVVNNKEFIIENSEEIEIVDVKVFKVKRTYYAKVIFESLLPF